MKLPRRHFLHLGAGAAYSTKGNSMARCPATKPNLLAIRSIAVTLATIGAFAVSTQSQSQQASKIGTNPTVTASALPQEMTQRQQAFRQIYQELVEINTTDSVGDTVKAAEAMAARLKASGLPAADIQVQFRPILQFSAGNAILNKGQSRLILRREVARGPARTISALS